MTLQYAQPRRTLVVARQGDELLTTWISALRPFSSEIHVFPLDAGRLPSDLAAVTVHRLFASLRPRLMFRLLTRDPTQLGSFPNYESHLGNSYNVSFIYPWLLHLELPGRPAARVSRQLRNTGSFADFRPYALARLIKRVKPDLVLSVGLEHAAAVTLLARDCFGPEFPGWLLCASDDRRSKKQASQLGSAQMSRIFSSIDFFAYEREADLGTARDCGLTGLALPVNTPSSIRIDLDQLGYQMPFPPSRRRTILIDCRNARPDSIVAVIDALDSCAETLQNFMTVVAGAEHREIFEAVTRIWRRGRFPVMHEHRPISTCPPELIGSSRLYFGGASPTSKETTFSWVYAAAMGAFPFQVCDRESSNWADLMLNGSSVRQEDGEMLKSGVMRALTDDKLVDEAAKQNLALARRKFSVDSALAGDSEQREALEEIFLGPRVAR